jgi:hypothetical protein
VEAPRAWRERMLLRYPNGGVARFDPRGRFLRAGDVPNGYVLDRFEVEREHVVAVLRVR